MRRSQPETPFKLLLGLLLITALASVLITPDPTDDVHAVLRSLKVAHAAVMAMFLACWLVLLVAETLSRRQAAHRSWSNSLQFLCLCRC